MNREKLEDLKKQNDKLEYDLLTRQNVYIEQLENKIRKLEKKTICGRTVDEVITILNGLDLERQLDIKVTMENLSYLFEEIMKQNTINQQEMLKEMLGKSERAKENE